VVNAFIDVQTSPDGDVYAIQNIKGEMTEERFYVYKYDVSTSFWNLTDKTFQAKAVRFDLLGNMYYLRPDNCTLNSAKVVLACGLQDFEVTAEGKIVGISDGVSPTVDTVSGGYRYSNYGY
jgi:hypothetical protein